MTDHVAAHPAASGGTPAIVRAPRGAWVPGRLTTIAVLLVTGALVLAAAYFANGGTASGGLTTVSLSGTPKGPAPVVGQPAPAFSMAQADGTAFSLADLKGKIVWLTFGASWCQPCRAENADVQATYEAFKAKGVVVVQVYMNEDAAAVNDYTSRVGITYTKIPDPAGRLSTDYRILGIPTHFFIDRDGVLRDIKIGTLQADAMARALTDLGAGG